MFVSIYFFNLGRTFSLTYDSIIMFSLYRYLNIEYPENLNLFFKSTDSFKVNLQIIKSMKKGEKVLGENTYSVKLLSQ